MNHSTDGSETMPNELPSLLANSRSELRWMLGFWAVLLVWVVGYCWLFGYGDAGKMEAGKTPSTFLGLPSWVVWGVFVPWFLAAVFTSWFAIYWIADDDLNTSDSNTSDFKNSDSIDKSQDGAGDHG